MVVRGLLWLQIKVLLIVSDTHTNGSFVQRVTHTHFCSYQKKTQRFTITNINVCIGCVFSNVDFLFRFPCVCVCVSCYCICVYDWIFATLIIYVCTIFFQCVCVCACVTLETFQCPCFWFQTEQIGAERWFSTVRNLVYILFSSLSLSPPLSPHCLFLNTSSLLFPLSMSYISFMASALHHPFPSSPSQPPDSRQWFMLVIADKTHCCSTSVKYVCCTMCVNLSVFSLTHLWPLLLPSQFKSFHPWNKSLSLLSNYTPPAHRLSPPSLGSYLFSVSGQNNSSQLTPISSPALPLLPLFFSFSSIHQSQKAPQD